MKYIKKIEKKSEYLICDNGFNKDSAKHFEGLFTQGNGYMHVRGSFEEGVKSVDQSEEYDRKPANVTIEKHKKQASKWGTFVPGVVGKHPFLMTEIVNLPYFFKTGILANGEALDMEDSLIEEYERYVDIRDGSLSRSFVWNLKDGSKVKLDFFRFLSMADRHLAFQEIKMTALSDNVAITAECGIDTGVRTNGFNHFTGVEFGCNEDIVSSTVKTNGGNTVCMSSKMFLSKNTKSEYLEKGSMACICVSLNLNKNEELGIHRVVACSTDADFDYMGQDSKTANFSLLSQISDEDFEKYYEKHLQAWNEKWDVSDVVIKGDDRTQKAVRVAIYHLLRADNEKNPNVAICAKGYAGEAYFGKYFWDTEICMLPFFIYSNPEAAKSLLMFRYNTLNGAKRNAQAYGYSGARYPWESSVSGEEECACWQYADHEVHVTADIIYAMMHYVNATGDEDFIKDFGIDVMVETARYWVERVDMDSLGRYVLLGVMGPDEYLPMTSNNTYTNRMVKFALDTTVSWINKYKESGEFNRIQERLSITEEDIAAFDKVRKNLKLSHEGDIEDGLILQCDEFLSYADIDFDKVWKDRSKCFGQFVSQEKNYRSKALKQADVLEMMMLYPDEFSDNQFEANYNYYEPITTHDSSLSATVHGIVASWMGKEEKALEFLDRVIDIDLCEEKLGAEEGIHIANFGGLWQLVVLGFAGMKTGFQSKEVTFTPHLPKDWEEVIVPVMWHGERKKYRITKDGYSVM